jgi:pantetheine-phosphate adenylyltransferase
VHVALYAGTFDPVTYGHLSVIERAARLFDRVLIVVAVNPTKRPMFSVEERLGMIRELVAACSNVECTSTSGYVVELAREVGAKYLIRGVRSCTDVEGEIVLANMNHRLAPEIETVFIPAHPELSEVSSSGLKQLVREGRDISQYCPAQIAARLEHRVMSSTLRPAEVTHG